MKIFYRFSILFLLTYVVLSSIVYFESQNDQSNIQTFCDAAWYSIITLTTVGYGDYYPITLGGRIISLVIVLASLGVLSYILSQVTLKITNYMDKKHQGYYGTKMEKHFVIIGWNSFSKQVGEQILKSGGKLAIICDQLNDVDLIQQTCDPKQVFVLYTEYSNYSSFTKANISKASKVFVNFEDDSQTLIHIINIKKHIEDVKFVVNLNSSQLKDTFRSIGTSFIVSKNEIASKLVASYIYEPEVAILTEDLMETSNTENETDIIQIQVLPGNEYANSKYIDVFLDVRKSFQSILLGVAVKSEDYKVHKNPEDDFMIATGDYLLIMANGQSKASICKQFKINEGRYAVS